MAWKGEIMNRQIKYQVRYTHRQIETEARHIGGYFWLFFGIAISMVFGTALYHVIVGGW
jgi:hypothetical protein